ncbi:fumarylacetoacetate hydrolase family protein [Brevibacillus marinus]|uniref:fumarylacetoacetate hydrolase family protein n=1 Tax=Brevibacillus marinus TaxID=2496837 RepID=UPI001F4950E3|nr:fumarylacetoacetate hydrolase family protein [Brevibacillus marinus]
MKGLVSVDIRNIYCVGRNYALHAKELGNQVPEEPFLFMKPSHAAVNADGGVVRLPGNAGEVHYEAELVLHISRPYEPGMPVEELVDQFALGIDFTLRDLQTSLKQKGLPWLRAKGFRDSAVLTRFLPFPGVAALAEQDFTLRKNGVVVQKGNISEMLFDIPTLLAFTATHFGLGAGDLLFTGTPSGVGPVVAGDQLTLSWGEQELGSFRVELSE